jgi:NAD-dependent SIR2 family protein deacetylase
MSTRQLRIAFVLGAGFSKYAGVPLQDEFTSALLAGQGSGGGPSGKVVQYLRKFVHRAFDHSIAAGHQFWPELEDIFTCLDMSANTGHNLGPKDTPSDLRSIRRALIYRVITMLRENYAEARERKDESWKTLIRLMNKIDPATTGFISTNWDTVIEDMLQETKGSEWFDYGCDARRASLHPDRGEIKEEGPVPEGSPSIIKMHGSVNWLYCDNCRRLYWFRPKDTNKVAGQLISAKEWETIDPETAHSKERWSCGACRAESVGTRLATFSYLKALDFPMFQKSWFSAERMLRDAENWIFLGYSLPGADFEFKYLLKRVQLSRSEPPNFVVVSGGKHADKTYKNYQGFFGRCIKKRKTFFDNGLDDKALDCISGLLDPE